MYAWEGLLREHTNTRIVLEATWQGPREPAVGEISFNFGDRFLEHYYPGQGYAIWQVESTGGQVKAWYCNLSTPVRETAGELSFEDLLLDVLVYPDGRYAILDRDEFEHARREGLPDERAREAEQALASVLALVESAADPFSFSGRPRLIAGS